MCFIVQEARSTRCNKLSRSYEIMDAGTSQCNRWALNYTSFLNYVSSAVISQKPSKMNYVPHMCAHRLIWSFACKWRTASRQTRPDAMVVSYRESFDGKYTSRRHVSRTIGDTCVFHPYKLSLSYLRFRLPRVAGGFARSSTASSVVKRKIWAMLREGGVRDGIAISFQRRYAQYQGASCSRHPHSSYYYR